jgi:hypothetical protein
MLTDYTYGPVKNNLVEFARKFYQVIFYRALMAEYFFKPSNANVAGRLYTSEGHKLRFFR